MPLPSRLLTLLSGGKFDPRKFPGLKLWADAGSGVYQDGAAHFTAASSQSLSIATNASVAFGDVDFWVAGSFYLDAKGAVRGFITKDNPSGTRGPYLLDYDSSQDRFAFAIFTGTVAKVAYANTFGAPSTSTWYHVIGWHDSVNDTVNICVNGGATDSTATGGGTPDASSNDFCIGSFHNKALPHDGRADSCAIGTVTGIASVISAMKASLYNSGNGKVYADLTSTEKTAWGLVSWWDLNEESGTRFDAIGTNHLTASNTALISPTVNNGGFETAGAGGADIWANWAEAEDGTSTLGDETVNVDTGSHAAKFVVDSSNDNVEITQSILTIGNLYSLSLRLKGGSGGESLTIGEGSPFIGGFSYNPTITSSYATYTTSFRAAVSTLFSIRRRFANATFYVDTITLTDLGPVGIAGIAAGLATDGNFCGQFNGTNQYLSIASNSSLQIGNVDAWFSQWVWFDAKPGVMNSFGKFEYGASVLEWKLEYDSGTDRIKFYVSNDGTVSTVVTASSFGSPPLDAWLHLFAWYDSVAGTINIRINNGSTDSTSYSLGILAGTTALGIGAAGAGLIRFWQGRVDSSLFGKSPPGGLTASASAICSALFNAGKGLKAKALTAAQKTAWGVVAGWDMDKQLGITADSVGTNTLTNNNAVTFGQGVDYFGGAVSKWLDRSGSGNHLTQATQSKRPVWYSNVQNGRPVIRFDGVDDLLNFTSEITTAVTIYAVLKYSDLVADYLPMLGDATAYYFHGGVGSNLFLDVSGTYPQVQDGSVYINGTLTPFLTAQRPATLKLISIVAAGNTAFDTIAHDRSLSRFFTGDYAALLVYNTAHNDAQRLQVENYLRSEYALY